ncbi:uncharacterized protein BXZ73DRAFT_74614 [Epithele typhae]|uniref:uncharacterized protein n=1 Tax=Epithele typhae TaxID=378194 RepID=UPI00200824CA|nr:uncharacterized protein BXZ73DRAFT_74614 [Epithele typhae]KAH9942338.1 hypothetical protein BXZ73DRAFT_74614 [Epithele typhae]
MSRSQVSQYALNISIDEGGFEDVKFFAFSQRMPKGGRAHAPRGLFGNSTCIRKVAPHFDAESAVADMVAGFPDGRWESTTTEYVYAEDSDLEDVEDMTEGEPATCKVQHVPDVSGTEVGAFVQKPPQKEDVQAENTAEAVVAENTSMTFTPHAVPGRTGRVIFLKDIAHRTWRAFIFYTYFGILSFAPLRSDPVTEEEAGHVGPFKAPQCSPKSMYRLADKYGVQVVKQQAAADINSKLTPNNIFQELFSSFTSSFPEILQLEVDYLFANLDRAQIMKELPIWMGYMAEGRLPSEAPKAMSMLITKMAAVVSKQRSSSATPVTSSLSNGTGSGQLAKSLNRHR